MSSSHQHQDNQVKMTNVAVVRLKKNGKVFEVAAYRNKVMSFRDGAEKRLDEVLQIVQVFQNVSRGLHSKSNDLERAFSTSDVEACCRIILAQGEMQVSDKERQAEYEQKFKDIASIVAAKCVNTQTGIPFTVQTIETAMHGTIHFAVNPTRLAKQQALEVIDRLKEHLPIARARMHLKITAPKQELLTPQAVSAVAGEGSEILSSTETSVEFLVDPSKFREMELLARKFEGSMSILEFAAHNDQETELGSMQQHAKAEPAAQTTEVASDADARKPELRTSVAKPTDATAATRLQCLSCGVDFAERAEQRAHYKSDFHTYNVKLKTTGLPMVTALEFANMSEADKQAVLFDWKA